MKFKTLRNKNTKNFVKIHEISGVNSEFSTGTPNLQPISATLSDMINYYNNLSSRCNIKWDELELVMFEMFEENTVGADIRNKLSPPLNLVSLIKLYLSEIELDKREKLVEYIKDEINRSEKSIKYLTNLL